MFKSQQVRFVGTAEKLEWVAANIIAILYPQADPRNYSNYLGKVPATWKDYKPSMLQMKLEKSLSLPPKNLKINNYELRITKSFTSRDRANTIQSWSA